MTDDRLATLSTVSVVNLCIALIVEMNRALVAHEDPLKGPMRMDKELAITYLLNRLLVYLELVCGGKNVYPSEEAYLLSLSDIAGRFGLENEFRRALDSVLLGLENRKRGPNIDEIFSDI